MELTNIVPWGRSFNEYIEMFLLDENDLKKKLLGCGDGPACFNAELTRSGGKIVSVDPVYQFSSQQIRSRIKHVYPLVMEQVSKNINDFVWTTIANIEELGRVRMSAMKNFLADYEDGKNAGRYINTSLPELPFVNGEFDLALCSHYLFLYSDHVDESQHILSIKELCRVAKEVRIYPLLSLDGTKSKHLEPVLSALNADGLDVSLQEVRYQFQKGATQMLVAKSV